MGQTESLQNREKQSKLPAGHVTTATISCARPPCPKHRLVNGALVVCPLAQSWFKEEGNKMYTFDSKLSISVVILIFMHHHKEHF